MVAVMAISLCMLAGCSSSGYKKAVDKYIDFCVKFDLNNIEDQVPEAYWDYIEEEYDVTLKDVKNQIKDLEDDYDEVKEYLKDYKISYEITDEDECDEDDLDDIRDDIKDNYGISKKDIKEAIILEIEISTENKEDEDDSYTEEITCIAVKIDGAWYLVDEDCDFLVGEMIDGIASGI